MSEATLTLQQQFEELITYPVFIETLNEYQITKLFYEYIAPIKEKALIQRAHIRANKGNENHPGSTLLQDALIAEKIILTYLKEKRHKGKFNRTAAQLKKQGTDGKRTPDQEKIDTVIAFLKANPIREIKPTNIFNKISPTHPEIKIDWLKKHIKKFKIR